MKDLKIKKLYNFNDISKKLVHIHYLFFCLLKTTLELNPDLRQDNQLLLTRSEGPLTRREVLLKTVRSQGSLTRSEAPPTRSDDVSHTQREALL